MNKDYIGNWLNEPQQDTSTQYKFKLIKITNKSNKTTDLIKDLQKELLYTYREKDFLDEQIFTRSKEDIIKYVSGMIPDDQCNINDNVRTGDFGEVLVKAIIMYFYKYIAYNKLKFKFNKNRSVFATDLVAFDDILNPESIYYYEIKTRTSLNKEDGSYITEIAYNGLVKDEDNAVQPVLDFMAQRFNESGKKELSAKYLTLALNKHLVKENYEIFILTNDISEKKINNICNALQTHQITLNPLSLNLVLVPELYEIRDEVWKSISNRAVEISESIK